MSNMGFDIAMKREGIHVVKTQVGDRYILEEMLRGGFNLGGEQSGHLIFFDHSTTGDGILSALQVLAVMKERGERLSKLAGIMTTLPQVIVNTPIIREKEPRQIPSIKKVIDEAENKLRGRGRILVRFSGTQRMCRVMVEGPSEKVISAMAKRIASAIEEALK